MNALKDFVLVSVGGEKITKKEQDYINEKLKGKFHHFKNCEKIKYNLCLYFAYFNHHL